MLEETQYKESAVPAQLATNSYKEPEDIHMSEEIYTLKEACR